MYRDERRANGCRYVHRAAVATDYQVGSLQERNKLGQARLASQVDGVLLHAACHALDERQIAGGSCQDYLGVLLAHQFIDQRCPVGDGPALGLPVIGADVAGNQRLTRL